MSTFLTRVREIIHFGLALFLYITGLVWLRTKILKRNGPNVRVILVHHIKNVRRFEKMVRYISLHCHPISYDDFVHKRFNVKKINVLLTMDDGYESWYTKGIPVLEQYQVPAVFFVSSGFVESSEDALSVERFCKDKLKLSWVSNPLTPQMLRESANHPLITIGGHTRTHPFLDQVDIETARQEILNDKKSLEDMAGRPLKIFAYPFGRGNYPHELSEILEEAGYEHALTTNSDFCNPYSNSYRLPRSNHGTVSPFVLGMWICGAFDLVERLENTIRRGFVK